MSKRLTNLLKRLAHKHAPYPPADETVRTLATHLARHGVLVLVADVPPHLASERQQNINAWIGHYGTLYQLLTGTFFPSLSGVRAVYADDALPPVIAIIADCDMVTRSLAGYVVPYVTARAQQPYNPLEARSVVSAMLEALGGADLTTGHFASLRDECVIQVRHLLGLPLQNTCLTDFAPPLLANWDVGTPPEPTPPPDLPDATTYTPPAKDDDLFSHPIPIFFRRKTTSSDDDAKPHPPVPPPPRRP